MGKIYIRRVDYKHYIAKTYCSVVDLNSIKKIPLNARQFLRKHYLYCQQADGAIVATCDGELVGFLKYYGNDSCYHAGGTWVAPKFRRKGVGTRMWELALKHTDEIDVSAGSEYGRRFLNNITKKYDQIFY